MSSRATAGCGTGTGTVARIGCSGAASPPDVVSVGSVGEARELLATDTDFGMAIVDRTMPEAPGRLLIPDLRRLVPGARIAFLTGDSVIGDERDMVDGVLNKPLTASELAEKVVEILASEPS